MTHIEFPVVAFGGKSKAAADRCDGTGAPKARKPSVRSTHPVLEGTTKTPRRTTAGAAP